MKRKIIQFAALQRQHSPFLEIIALCKDGSLWQRVLVGPQTDPAHARWEWKPLGPKIPDRPDPPDDL